MKFVISKFKLDRQFTKEEREFFVDCVKKTGEIESNISNAKTKSMTILELPKLTGIKSFCLSSLNQYSNNSEIKIRESWLNFTMPGEWQHSQNHLNSLVSGIFFLNVRKGLHSIEFTEIQKIIEVERLDLFLFPSQLLHQSPKNISNDFIMTLSFNCF